MATTLFELEAKLGLNAGGFDTGVDNARGSMEGLQSDISTSISSIDAEIKALDDEILELDKEIAGMELDLEHEDLDAEIADLEGQIRNLDFKGALLEGLSSGLTEVAGDLIQEAFAAGFEFLGDSITKAAESGSAAAAEYQRATARMQLGTENLSSAIGDALLPMLTGVLNTAADILGITNEDVAMSMMDKLQSYAFENLQQAEERLENIFDLTDQADFDSLEEMSFTFEDVLGGYESQQEYWERYTQMVTDLRARGVDQGIISQYATGNKDDFGMLNWLSSLTDDQIAQLEAAEAANEAARTQAALIFSSMALEQDTEYNAMLEEYNRLTRSPEVSPKGSGVNENGYGGGGRRFGSEEAEAFSEVASSLKQAIEAMPGQTAETVAAAINGVTVEMYGEVVGRIISDNIIAKAKTKMLGQ